MLKIKCLFLYYSGDIGYDYKGSHETNVTSFYRSLGNGLKNWRWTPLRCVLCLFLRCIRVCVPKQKHVKVDV